MKSILVVLFSVTASTLFSVAAIAKDAHPKHSLSNLVDSHSEAQKLEGTIPAKYDGTIKSFSKILQLNLGGDDLIEPFQ